MAGNTVALPRRRGGVSGLWLAGGVALIVVAIVTALFINNASKRAAASVPATIPVTRGNLIATVAGSGTIAAEQSLDLPFQAQGTVTEILVKEGATVQTGQPLARLDDRDLQLQVASAQASLDSARARLAQAQQGNAGPEDVASAQAQVNAAQAAYDKIANGPNAGDLAAARAAVTSAVAAYDAAVKSGGTSNTQLTSAAATLQKARPLSSKRSRPTTG